MVFTPGYVQFLMADRNSTLNAHGSVAVISDVHAHLDALKAVIADIDREGITEIWFLGDAVGYGPHPQETVALLRERATITLAGNHDHLVASRLHFGEAREHSATAWDSGTWTREQLDEETIDWLGELEPHLETAAVALHHADPHSITRYVYDAHGAAQVVTQFAFEPKKPQLFLLGHTHIPQAWKEVPSKDGTHYELPEAHPADEGSVIDLSSGRWLLNPGSVGFPRLDDKRAHWLLLDFDQQTATFRRTAVDHFPTQQAIRESELPAKIADKLDEPLPSRGSSTPPQPAPAPEPAAEDDADPDVDLSVFIV